MLLSLALLLQLPLAQVATPDAGEFGSDAGTRVSSPFDGTRFYLGASAAIGGFTTFSLARDPPWSPELQVAVHGGIWTGRTNLDLEIVPVDVAFLSPGVASNSQGPRPTFTARLSLGFVAGTLAPATGNAVLWPLRLWAGISYPGFGSPGYNCSGSPTCSNLIVYPPGVSVQLSLVGFAIRTGRTHVEVNLLSPFVVFDHLGPIGFTFLSVRTDIVL